ncbi:hypothetical protein Tco_1483892 [Tanacetum coccineum]
MKDLGEAAYILGIKIIRDRSRRLISLSQSAYLEKILKNFRMENSKKGYTSMMEKPNYRKSQGAKHLLRRFQQNPGEIHWTAVKTILNSNSPGLSTGSFAAATIGEDTASMFSQTNRSDLA